MQRFDMFSVFVQIPHSISSLWTGFRAALYILYNSAHLSRVESME